MLDRSETSVEAGKTGTMRLASATLRNMVDDHAEVLREVLKPDQVRAIEAVADDSQRSSRATTGSAAAVGPGTAKDLVATRRFAKARNLGGILFGAGARMATVGAGAYFSEAAGAMVANAIGEAAHEVTRGLRAEHATTAQRLVQAAILDPQQMRMLLAQAPPPKLAEIAGRFAKRAVQSSMAAGR